LRQELKHSRGFISVAKPFGTTGRAFCCKGITSGQIVYIW
jgi:hypothetical protein